MMKTKIMMKIVSQILKTTTTSSRRRIVTRSLVLPLLLTTRILVPVATGEPLGLLLRI